MRRHWLAVSLLLAFGLAPGVAAAQTLIGVLRLAPRAGQGSPEKAHRRSNQAAAPPATETIQLHRQPPVHPVKPHRKRRRSRCPLAARVTRRTSRKGSPEPERPDISQLDPILSDATRLTLHAQIRSRITSPEPDRTAVSPLRNRRSGTPRKHSPFALPRRSPLNSPTRIGVAFRESGD